MLLRQVFLRAKFFARKKHDVRVRKPKKEKNVRFRIRIRLMKRTCPSWYKSTLSFLIKGIKNFIGKEFHRKDVKKNAWKAVAEELGFEDGKNI